MFPPRKKIHEVGLKAPFSQYKTVISYEKDYTDMLRMPANAKVIICESDQYYPYLYHTHSSADIEAVSQAISQLHKQMLGCKSECRL